jgi:hypothetical protein
MLEYFMSNLVSATFFLAGPQGISATFFPAGP